MNQNDTADSLKRRAITLKKEMGISHHGAFDKAAQSHGSANWTHFSNTKRGCTPSDAATTSGPHLRAVDSLSSALKITSDVTRRNG